MYEQVSVELSKIQITKLRKLQPMKLRFKPSQFYEGAPHSLLFPETALKKIGKGKGFELTFSENLLKKNKDLIPLKGSKTGGNPLLGMLAEPLLGVFSSVASDAIRDIFGSGVEETLVDIEQKTPPSLRKKALDVMSEPKNKKMVESAKTPEQMMKVVEKISKKNPVGGQLGAGWQDALLWSAAWLNPFGMFTGPLLTNIKAGQKIVESAQGGELQGSGVVFL